MTGAGMDWAGLRRIITKTVGDRSCVLIDGPAASTLALEEAGLAEIWQAALGPGAFEDDADALAGAPVILEPPRGSVKVRWFTTPVEDPALPAAAREEQAAFGFAACGASHARVDTRRHPMMHRTETLDIIILVRGAVDLLLDDGEALSMKPGDVVVQRATNHAWVNTGDETALLVAVLIDPPSDEGSHDG